MALTSNDSLYYWLNIVRLLGDNSPVLLIKNEKQKRQCDLDEGSLRKEFPNLINQSLCVDFADNSGLDPLYHQIQHHITQLSGVNDSWPHNWAKVRYALENYSKNPNAHYITQADYITLCQREGVTDRKEALTISNQLHELGICLHFPDPGLRHYVILRPAWVTNAVYKVTDDKKVQADFGRFHETDLDKIWSDNEYSEVKGELLQLMQKFGICYPLRNQLGCYIAPSLLSTDRPNYTWNHSNNLILRYEYDFMPKGILTRLIVETHELIEPAPEVQGLVWKNGVILRKGNARAEVIENRVKREINIQVSGAQQVYLLSTIRLELERIHNSFQGNLDVREYVPCNCSHCIKQKAPHMFLLSTLEYRLSKNRNDDECDISFEKVDIRRLIYNIGGADPALAERASPGFRGNSTTIYTDKVELTNPYQEAPQTMTTFNQTNHGGNNSQNKVEAGATAYIGTTNITHNPEPKTPAEAAKEITDLLIQLAKDNPCEFRKL